jgi:thioester reductase-like protein/1-acyl-sn-glycerol-3-phosphate acyltransferase
MSIASKYAGRTVFITGATGFVGKIIVEKLLRSCPDVRRIYLLIRAKKELGAAPRLQALMDGRVFNRLRLELGVERYNALVADKVHAIAGDVGKEECGMSADDVAVMEREVNIWIHSAATINFNEPMHVAVNLNVLGTLRLFAIAKRSAHLEAFAHISTAYVNCNKKGAIEEKLYPLDYSPQQMLQMLLDTDPAELERQTPKLIRGYPNTYTFTKSLTEHLLVQRRDGAPLLIFRPSIIGASYKEPSPGWLDVISAASSLYLTAGVGVMKFVLARRPDRIGDQVPADTVVHALLAATADIASSDRLLVCQCGTSANKPLTWAFVRKTILPYLVRRPPKRVFAKPDFNFVTSDALYHILYFLQYRVPVETFNAYATVFGTDKQRKQAATWRKLAQRVESIADNFNYFVNNEWIFDTKHTYEVWNRMSPDDQRDFNFDMKQIDWEEYLLSFLYGMKVFILKEHDVAYPLLDRSLPLALRRDLAGDMAWAWHGSPSVNDIYRAHPPEQLGALVLASPPVRAAIAAEAARDQVSLPHVDERARQILARMHGTISMPLLRVEGYLFRKIYRHLYRAILLDEFGMRLVQRAAKSGPVVLIPTHRSYIDFLLLSYVFFDHNLPVPRIAAGDDFLNMFMIGRIFRNSGAFFMRRSLGDDALYREIFSEYIASILEHGQPFEFFLEGTRSRSNKCLPPKLGVMSIVTDAVLSGRVDNITICPITINYQRIVEEQSHARELAGENKTKPTTTALVQTTLTKLVNLDLGRISVQFAEPISLRQYIVQQQALPNPAAPVKPSKPRIDCDFDNSLLYEIPRYLHDDLPNDPLPPLPDLNLAQRKALTRSLGYRVIHSFHCEMMCMTTAIVAALLLVYRTGISKDLLVEKFAWLRDAIILNGSRVDPVAGSDLEVVQDALRLLGDLVVERRNIVEPNTEHRGDYQKMLQLSMYRNGIVHVFQREGIVALTLASFGVCRSSTPTARAAQQAAAQQAATFASASPASATIENDNFGVTVEQFRERHQFLSSLFRDEFVDDLRDTVCHSTPRLVPIVSLIDRFCCCSGCRRRRWWWWCCCCYCLSSL